MHVRPLPTPFERRKTIGNTLLSLPMLILIAAGPTTQPSLTENVRDAKGLDFAVDNLHAPMRETDALPPSEAAKRLKLREGLAVDLIAAEPTLRQPLCINFDERGRMWVVQYIQYPFPAGLKVVEYDRYIRAKFDKIPNAPPQHTAGRDIVSILEDVDRDGSFRSLKTFVTGLNIATSALPGRGGGGPGDYGVWVLNPPYLLFYPDKNRDDVPDADPIVHLSGFGLEDTHSVASNLTWGPDGWLWGANGSTCTAKVRTLLGDTSKTTDFLGQCLWRYHPERHTFEIFAEGGGNTFGLEFDDAGRSFSGTNNAKLRGMHYVQGAYGKKTWGKHGPLTNPYAYGFFDHMPHDGDGERLTHTFVVYGGSLFPAWRGKVIGPNSLQSRVQMTRLEPIGSTFRTIEETPVMSSDDGWFRPVDLKTGPDGALYVADFYEKRISHVDPRDTWERSNGRLWRIRPSDWKPVTTAMDLYTEPADRLVERLSSEDRWERATARRVLTDRGDSSASASLRRVMAGSGPPALDALQALYGIGSLGEPELLAGLKHAEPTVREWAVRLAADVRGVAVTSAVFDRLLDLADREEDPHVRSQLASSAKRLPGEQSVALVSHLLRRAEDSEDPHIPMLLWWAVEAHADRWLHDSAASAAIGKTKIGSDVVAPRLVRRAIEASVPDAGAVTMLLDAAADADARQRIVDSVNESLVGRDSKTLDPQLSKALSAVDDLELRLRFGVEGSAEAAVNIINDDKSPTAKRVRLIDAVAQSRAPVESQLLDCARRAKQRDVRLAAIAGLARYESVELARGLTSLYTELKPGDPAKPAVVAALLSRPTWAVVLLEFVGSKAIPPAALSAADVERIRQFDDARVAALAEQILGKPVRATDAEKAAETDRVRKLVTTGTGDLTSGKALFAARCQACHSLFGEGGQVGPDLTEYDRRNANDMAVNIVDPSAYIREEYASFRVETRAGDVHVGLIAERAGDRLTIVDAAQQKVTIPLNDLTDERALTVSLMPEGLLAGLSDQQVRDLFKYIASERP